MKSPTVRVIDMAKPMGTSEDRFAVPKGSLQYSRAGTQFLGLLDRPSLKVMRWNFEATKAAQNEAAEARQNSVPTGRRHDAFYAYLAAVREGERANGHAAAWERAAERCRRTQRPPHLASSADNFLEWKCDDTRPSTPGPRPSAGWASPEQVRPQTAPAGASESPTSWSMWNQAVGVPSSPRFQARAAFEYKRCTTPDLDDIKKQTYAKLAARRSAGHSAAAEREAALVAEWPHGMPAGPKRAAAAAGVAGAPMGHGFPLSLPESQYAALYGPKSGAKWY